MKMLTKLPTLIEFNILSTDRQDNPLLAKPMPFQVLDRCWHSDALFEVGIGSFRKAAVRATAYRVPVLAPQLYIFSHIAARNVCTPPE